ncbi:unnamed protein product [Effrenium voratum]|uniref:Uncharacterized protein n=1 Tax=Effrenium voratum TaxID=2562239 RepID=A0AA36I7Q7_9DINO|nr:unnamed protein product [Effrenium voratum]CAJ1418825.1 unnamed protein product [Effrenium voratum]
MSARGSSPSDGESGDEQVAVKIEQKWAVTSSGSRTWLPTTVEKAGAPFVKLAKFDRGFVKFCLNKTMSSTSKKGDGHRNANVPHFDAMLGLRKEASVLAASAALEMEDSLPEDSKAVRRKKRKVREEDAHLVSPIVTIQTPQLEWKGVTHESRGMRVLWGLTSKNLWIELTVENMSFMKNLVASGQKQLKPRKRASPKKKLRNAESGALPEAPAIHAAD